MNAISLSFPAGRYHATPWGRHVNEGAVEWPPSPWRLLRSLVAVWKRTLPEFPEAEMRPIFGALASESPRFVLPRASAGHTRHYMPIREGSAPKSALVFDTFVALDPREPLSVVWPGVTLAGIHRTLLDRVLANINYLGRSESWCEAQLMPEESAAAALEDGNRVHAAPLDPASDPDSRRGMELVRTLCADPASAFDDTHIVEVRTTTTGRGKQKITTDRREPVYDPNWHLCMETLRLHEQRWSDPPGSRWVTYTRPLDCFEIKPAAASRRRASRECSEDLAINVARFALDSTVLPPVTETLHVAEAARRALMSIHGRLTADNGHRGRSDVLSGKDADGSPLNGHRHAYYLPADEDGDGRLDHLTVFAAGGFDPNVLHAFEQLRSISGPRSGLDGEPRHPLRVVLLGTGPGRSNTKDATPRSPVACSKVWVSATPYLVSRYPKTRGTRRVDLSTPAARVSYIRNDLVDCLRSARPDLEPLTGSIAIEPITDELGRPVLTPTGGGPADLRPLQFKRFRRKPSDDGGRRLAGAFRITFPEPVMGPIAPGHSSHFGMGLFLPLVGDHPRSVLSHARA
ncbi:MAG: type I-U CRISPR-associated protein Cas5/Cas6 [Phycisphaeraceae bacterium]|nr:MAG: type I-U CRISPR-associated protein Cas5/Cas6 [Phycisphaeraceae bacterium]